MNDWGEFKGLGQKLVLINGKTDIEGCDAVENPGFLCSDSAIAYQRAKNGCEVVSEVPQKVHGTWNSEYNPFSTIVCLDCGNFGCRTR